MALEFKLPELGESITSGDVINVFVGAGDSISKGQFLFEIEAGKTSMEIPSPASGIIVSMDIAEGDTVEVGQLVLTIKPGEEAAVPVAKETSSAEPELVVSEPNPRMELAHEPKQSVMIPAESAVTRPAKAVSAAPNVRRLARELGVDIHAIKSSDVKGRISLKDVKNYTKSILTSGGQTSVQGGVFIEKMSAVRKATMSHMAACWAAIPHVTQHDKADITRLNALRKQFAKKAEAAGSKLTLTAMIVKIIASALRAFPKFNCSIDSEKAEITYKNFYHINIAVDTEKGLIAPVIRNADRKNMIELAQDLGLIALRAREGKTTPSELLDGTFTITNLGGIGGSFFTPIVNAPQVAILGVGRATLEKEESGPACLRMPLSLSYDHRIIDGADGSRFLRWIVEALEEPLLLSLEG